MRTMRPLSSTARNDDAENRMKKILLITDLGEAKSSRILF